MASREPGEDSATASSSASTAESQSAYGDLKRLIPSLASELDQLRAALREHNLWLQRYGHADRTPADPYALRQQSTRAQSPPPPLSSGAATDQQRLPQHLSAQTSPQGELPPPPPPPPAEAAAGAAAGAATVSPPPAPTNHDPELPAYSASDVPPYTGGLNSVSASTSSTRDEVEQRRDQLVDWLSEGEDVLREYSARFAQLAQELNLPAEDLLGTWNEASPDNALPDYERIETNEDLMVGGVGEVPPPYIRGDLVRKNTRG
ncbi:hypothetical protein BX600DRAFT_443923 [Xylariales sp. PMI_506]|nr:hypothetical protein BX600DRAFT_443923 [Xylariales sp. PMI_506]